LPDNNGDYDYVDTSNLSVDSACSLENQALCELDRNSFDKATSVSKTDDMSDIKSLLLPDWGELKILGHQVNEMIGQCSFDNTPCSYKYV
jgi:hypothetical protein